MFVWPAKPPAAVEKYAFDFTAALNGETISGTPVIVADGVTKVSQAVAGAMVNLLLSGGTAGTVATVACTLVTSGGETLYALGVLAIGGEAVDLATAKAAQRIEGDEEDALLAGFLRAATRAIEQKTGKNLTAKVETQVVNGFGAHRRGGEGQINGRCAPDAAAIRLYRGPVSSILEIAYDDSAGVEQMLADFRLVEGANAQLLPVYGAAWPVTADGAGSVRISYVAGYEPADLPPDLSLAVILLFGHYNANREAVIAGNAAQAAELPLGVEMLIAPYRAPGIA